MHQAPPASAHAWPTRAPNAAFDWTRLDAVHDQRMDNGYYITEGLDEPLRRMLDTAMGTLEALRERGHEAIQYTDEPTYVIDAQEVWDHNTRALYAVQNAVAIL